MPGSSLQLLIDATGRFAVKNGSESLHEVLAGTNVTRDRAVANDLSMFGGLESKSGSGSNTDSAVNVRVAIGRGLRSWLDDEV